MSLFALLWGSPSEAVPTTNDVVVNGRPRAMVSWRGNSGTPWLAIGTHSRLYAYNGELEEITPSGLTIGQPDASFGTGEYGAGTYGLGLYGVGDTTSPDVTPATVWSLDTFGQYLVGCLPTDGRIVAWDLGASYSGTGTVSVSGTTATFSTNQDTYLAIGFTLVSDGQTFTLTAGSGTSWTVSPAASPAITTKAFTYGITDAQPLGTVTFPGTATGFPTSCRGVVVTPERFLVALGAGGDGRLVQWASQESLTDWTPTALNSAGDFPLSTVGRLMAGRRSRGETLLWTDVDVWAMRYQGGPLVFGFERVGTNCGVIAPNAMATLDGVTYWMGENGFHAYDGFVQDVPSEVSDYLFSDFNALQASKVTAVSVSAFNEVWWFYPSAGSQENDRYVIYNVKERHWSVGMLSRTCGVDEGAFPTPIMASPEGTVYQHESGWDHEGLTPAATTGPLEIGAGDAVMMVRRIIPDERTVGDVQAQFGLRFWPNAASSSRGPYPLSSPTNVRFTARQVGMTVEQVRDGDWRVGTIRLDVTPGGER